MVHEHVVDGFRIHTGDLICTADGDGHVKAFRGMFWSLLGKIIPGEADHIVIYIGPAGRCIEAAAKGKVVTFSIPNATWDWKAMVSERGEIVDTLLGVVNPLGRSQRLPADENRIRAGVAQYCLAQMGKPYNLNFAESDTDRAFYCSQLAYKAYKQFGIDLNTGTGVKDILGTRSIIFPEEIWQSWPRRARGA